MYPTISGMLYHVLRSNGFRTYHLKEHFPGESPMRAFITPPPAAFLVSELASLLKISYSFGYHGRFLACRVTSPS